MLRGFLRFIANLALFLFFAGLVLFVAELGLRSYFQIPSRFLSKIVRFDKELSPSKRLKPDLDAKFFGAFREFQFHVTTDRNGFRVNGAQSLTVLQPEIVVLGDSQTFGVGVHDDETFSSRLSGKLEEAVLNTGCPGYNTYEEYALAKSIASYLKPKTLILSFFPGNDPYENFQATQPVIPVRPVASARKAGPLAKAKDYLVKNSAIYNLIMRLRRYEAINKLFFSLHLVNDAPPQELEVFKKTPSFLQGAFWAVTDKAILQISDLCKTHGIRLVVLFIPDRYQVDDDYWQQWLTKYHLGREDFDLRAPNKHMSSLCERHGISFVDPMDLLLARQEAQSPVYWRIDNHLSPEGHRVIADNLSSYLWRAKKP